MLSSHVLLALYHHTQILPQELALLAKLIHDLQERMYQSVHRDDRRFGDSSNHVVEKLMEHPLFGVTTLLLLVFISAVDPAENHKLLRRTLPDQQDQSAPRVDTKGRKLNDFTHARYGPAGNFHDAICDFSAEHFDNRVLFPFVADVAAAQSDPNIDPAHVGVHPRNSQPFAGVMHFAWRLMRGGSAAEGTAGGGDPLKLAEQCRNLLTLRPFAFLRALLRYPGIRHDGHRDLYCSIIFDLFAQFLDHLKRSRTKLDVNQFSYLKVDSHTIKINWFKTMVKEMKLCDCCFNPLQVATCVRSSFIRHSGTYDVDKNATKSRGGPSRRGDDRAAAARQRTMATRRTFEQFARE